MVPDSGQLALRQQQKAMSGALSADGFTSPRICFGRSSSLECCECNALHHPMWSRGVCGKHVPSWPT